MRTETVRAVSNGLAGYPPDRSPKRRRPNSPRGLVRLKSDGRRFDPAPWPHPQSAFPSSATVSALHGGFYLSEPKAGSSGTIDLDPVVGDVLAEHVRQFPPTEVPMIDIASGDPVRRTVPLLFTTRYGHPFTDALRHFFATTLITNHAEPQEVRRLLRHKSLRITLEREV